ncbi:MFS transporter [Marinobacter sp. R17]|uniref:MFS transporter n=1 Tax=Marinobacter mangrovi TaxID=2803918 RepID=UPI000F4C9F02|nr:MFS transporter [Marinobacter mangrovi]ROT99989.1 MFS transporter [Marinobacter sp. R17]
MYWRLSNLYFWFFALLGAMLPYWSLYLEDRGFSYLQIAALMATIQLTKIVAPNVWGWLGDRTGQRVRLVRLGSVVGAICFTGVFLEPGFYGLMLVMLAFTFFWNAILPLYEVITLQGLGKDRARYGRVRLWGSVGFIASVALVGLILEYLPLEWLPAILMPLFFGIAVAAFCVPSRQGQIRPQTEPGGLRAIVMQSTVLAFFAMNFLLQVSHGAYYTFFSIHLESLGYDKFSVGLLWSLGVAAEIVLFIVMHRVFRRYSARTIAIGALVLTGLRWMLIAEYSADVPILVFAQLLHAASYGALHAVSVNYIHSYFGHQHHGQGQALYSGLTYGAGGAVGAWLSGLLVEWQGTALAFWGSAVAIGMALMIAAIWLRSPPEYADAH